MFRRGEHVPFAFVAEADRFRSNVTPPRRPRRSRRNIAEGALFGLVIVAGLIGSVLLGAPALDPERQQTGDGRPPAAEGR